MLRFLINFVPQVVLILNSCTVLIQNMLFPEAAALLYPTGTVRELCHCTLSEWKHLEPVCVELTVWERGHIALTLKSMHRPPAKYVVLKDLLGECECLSLGL